MYCTKKFYILIIIGGFTSIKNGLNSKFYVKFIKGINKLLPMNIIYFYRTTMNARSTGHLAISSVGGIFVQAKKPSNLQTLTFPQIKQAIVIRNRRN